MTNAIKEHLTPPKLSTRKKSATAPPAVASSTVVASSSSGDLKSSPSLSELSTDGLVTHELVIQVQNQTHIYSLWDFAGQEVYLPTHMFFLTPRAIYLLAFDMSKPLAESYKSLDYWMRVLRSVAPKAPVLLVGTHADAKLCTPEYTASVIQLLAERYNNSGLNTAGFVDVSSKTRKNLPVLVRALDDTARENAAALGMGEELPNLYWLLEHQLRQVALTTSPPIVTFDQFNAIALRCGLVSTAHALSLIIFR